MKIAYLGIPGSYSHIIAKRASKLAVLSAKKSFVQIAQAVDKGEADLGILPIENSLSGSVWRVYNLLSEYDLNIVAERYLQIEHHLLVSKKGAKTRAQGIKLVKKCYSHPQVFNQCRQFFRKFKHIKKIRMESTAQAARKIAKEASLSKAAIASSQAAKIYKLKVLKKNIEDGKQNYTRFVIIGKKKPKRISQKEGKISLIFSIKHEPGSLYKVLQPFAQRKINLTKIESRPIFGQPWEYIFYLDFEFKNKKLMRGALDEMKKNVIFLKVLGPYPKEGYAKT